MRRLALLIGFLFFILDAFSQSTEKLLLRINTQIDESVVNKKIHFLKKHYANDFVFTHGTGLVDGKEDWIKNVANPATQFISRKQDSTTVELHANVALVTGKIDIIRKDQDKNISYGIWYIRVYQKSRGTWKMISHRTTKEWHKP